jgi:hypothetical protein
VVSARRCSRLTLLAAGAAVLLVPRLGRADVAECVAAHSRGQSERNAGHLQSAKANFVACSKAGCPAAIQTECVALLAELEAYIATVVFAAVDEDGNDATDVVVKVDDQQVLDKLTGLSTALDPGSHTVTYVWPDGFEQKQTVVVAQGEKNRRVELRREKKVTETAPPPPPPKTEPTNKGAPVAAYVLGGVGVLALGSFVTFAVLGKSAQSDMDGCKPYCGQAQADKMRMRYLIADISLGVSLVSLGASGYLFVRASREPSGNALNGGTVMLGGSF